MHLVQVFHRFDIVLRDEWAMESVSRLIPLVAGTPTIFAPLHSTYIQKQGMNDYCVNPKQVMGE